MKKVLSFLLVLIASFIFMVACANEPEPQPSPGSASEATPEPTPAPTPTPTPTPESTPEPTPKPQLEIVTRIKQGDTQALPFGDFTWRVLVVEDNKALLLTEKIVEQRGYHNTAKTPLMWEDCDLRAYLNGEFLERFSSVEQAQIMETRIANPVNLWWGTDGGNDTTDKVFLLSLEEADRYFGDSGDYLNEISPDGKGWWMSNEYDIKRVAMYEDEAWWWWLRSPGKDSHIPAYVDIDGALIMTGSAVQYLLGGVRPALWLNLES